MPKIDEMPTFRAKLPTFSHDLSHDFTFSATTAHLLPVFHDFLNAGEHVNVGFNFNLTTMPMQAAAKTRLTCHVEYFFVPMFLLYTPWGSFRFGINDEYSTNFANLPLNDNLPNLDFGTFASQIETDKNRKDLVYTYGGYTFGECLGQMCNRLAEHLGFVGQFDKYSSTGQLTPNVFPYPYLAYNCIYQYYYRLDNREQFNPSLFNWDQFFNLSNIGPSDITQWPYFLSVKYRPLGNDYFTDIKVSPIVDVLNLNDKSTLEVATQWLTRSINAAGNVLSSGNTGSSSSAPFGATPASSIIQTQFGFKNYSTTAPQANGFDIGTANIRAMFATEKLWSITGRAKKHYDDQVLAHFGFKVPHDPKHEITCFGHDTTDIQIGEVISTSDTYDSNAGTGAPMGEIAGKGYASMKSKMHQITAPCDGVVMAIFSVVADRNYIDGFPKYNVMTNRADLYQPEYDHLGMQPLFGYEALQAAVGSANYTAIAGWQYRYEQWKRRYNRATSAFRNGSPFESWVNYSKQYQLFVANTANTAQYCNFLNLPTDINDIMLAQYDTTAITYANDPFVVASHITCHKRSTMSDYSLPRLDA